MEYVTLGKTGLRVSRMGLGGIPIQKIDAEGTKTLLHKLADRGVNYIDTARGYTVSEEYLGYALEGIRNRFIIATKSMARTKEAMLKILRRVFIIFVQIILNYTRCIIRVWNSLIRCRRPVVPLKHCRRQEQQEK